MKRNEAAYRIAGCLANLREIEKHHSLFTYAEQGDLVTAISALGRMRKDWPQSSAKVKRFAKIKKIGV